MVCPKAHPEFGVNHGFLCTSFCPHIRNKNVHITPHGRSEDTTRSGKLVSLAHVDRSVCRSGPLGSRYRIKAYSCFRSSPSGSGSSFYTLASPAATMGFSEVTPLLRPGWFFQGLTPVLDRGLDQACTLTSPKKDHDAERLPCKQACTHVRMKVRIPQA